MLQRWKKRWISDVQFDNLVNNALKILNKSNVIVFTYQATGANWLGVQNATKSMYPDNFLILPQSYGNSLLSEKQRKKFTEILIQNGLSLVIFSGLPSYCFEWIKNLNNAQIETGIIFHGGLAEFSGNYKKQDNFRKIIQFSKNGFINRIGIVKKGLDNWLGLATSLKINRVLPALNFPTDLKIKKRKDGKIHIGIFANSTYNKNRHSQIAAASLIENSVIHILEPNEFDYILPKSRLRIHNNLSRKDFLELLGSMDVNLYCSYSESWGQVIIESMALDVPCIYSNNSGISELIESNQCMVQDYDNIMAITNKIRSLLDVDFSLKFNKKLYNKRVQELNSEMIKI